MSVNKIIVQQLSSCHVYLLRIGIDIALLSGYVRKDHRSYWKVTRFIDEIKERLMKKKLLVGLAAVLFMLSMDGIAVASLLNFDDLLVDDDQTHSLEKYSNDGFVLSNSSGEFIYYGKNMYSFYEKGALLPYWTPSITKVAKESGALFTLNSIDLKIHSSSGAVNLLAWDADGERVGLVTHSQNVSDGWQTITFGDEFKHIAYMTISQDGTHWYLDNLNLDATTVPIPGAVWLFGFGLMGLAGIPRGKSKK